jgi:hypothetical protein
MPKPYPVTNDLRLKLKDLVEKDPSPSGLVSNDNPEFSWNRIVDTALEYIGEYEHGSVDTSDLIPYELMSSTDDSTLEARTLKVMAAVLEDFIGSLFMGLGGTKERNWTN